MNTVLALGGGASVASIWGFLVKQALEEGRRRSCEAAAVRRCPDCVCEAPVESFQLPAEGLEWSASLVIGALLALLVAFLAGLCTGWCCCVSALPRVRRNLVRHQDGRGAADGARRVALRRLQ